MSEGAVSSKASSVHCQPNAQTLLIIVVVVVIIEVRVPSAGGRRPRPAVVLAAACRPFLRSDEVYDGRDDSAVLGLAVLPIHRSRVTDFVLQQRVQLSLQTLQDTKRRAVKKKKKKVK